MSIADVIASAKAKLGDDFHDDDDEPAVFQDKVRLEICICTNHQTWDCFQETPSAKKAVEPDESGETQVVSFMLEAGPAKDALFRQRFSKASTLAEVIASGATTLARHGVSVEFWNDPGIYITFFTDSDKEEEITLHKADIVTAKRSVFLWEMDEITTTEVSDDEWHTITGKVMTDQRLARVCSLKWTVDKIGRVLQRRYGTVYDNDMERYRRCAERMLFPLAQQQDSPLEWLPPVNFIESAGITGTIRDGRRLTISFAAGRATFDAAMDIMNYPRFSDDEWDFACNQDNDDDDETGKEPEAWTAAVLVQHLAMLRGHGDDHSAVLRSPIDIFEAFLSGQHIVRVMRP